MYVSDIDELVALANGASNASRWAYPEECCPYSQDNLIERFVLGWLWSLDIEKAWREGEGDANKADGLCGEDCLPDTTCAECGCPCSTEHYCSKDAGVQCFEHYCENCIESHGCEGDEE